MINFFRLAHEISGLIRIIRPGFQKLYDSSELEHNLLNNTIGVCKT